MDQHKIGISNVQIFFFVVSNSTRFSRLLYRWWFGSRELCQCSLKQCETIVWLKGLYITWSFTFHIFGKHISTPYWLIPHVNFTSMMLLGRVAAETENVYKMLNQRWMKRSCMKVYSPDLRFIHFPILARARYGRIWGKYGALGQKPD